MIKKENGKYNVYNEAGTKKLGSHDNHHDAVRQLVAIEISKEKDKKKAKT